MNNTLFRSVNKRIDQLLSYPGIDENSLQLKKNVWLGDIVVGSATAGMTIMGWLLGLPVIVQYGIVMLSIIGTAIILVPFLRKHVDLLDFFLQMLAIWGTFYFMVRMGGLLTSAGLIFCGITALSLSINYQNDRLTLWLFVAYFLSLVITAILQPLLHPAPELTPGKNLLFFTVNFSWQAGMTLLLSLKNINQKKKIGEAKKAEADRLKKLDELKSRFFTNITHEFRTPLAIILGMAKLTKEQPEEWLEEGTRKISSSGRYLLNLVNQMLDLARLESGSMPVYLFQQDIIFQLNYLADSFQSLAQNRDTELVFEADTGAHLMDYDHEKLMQIVTNLLSNAIKYSPKGSRVILSTKMVNPGNPYREIQVSDNGPGIGAEHLEHIFDRFYRVEDGTLSSDSGTGLGLALTQELVKLMEGTIEVKSLPGEGTTFRVVLPVSNNAPVRQLPGFFPTDGDASYIPSSTLEKPGKQTLSAGPEVKKPILLIVEDNPDLTNYLTAILQKYYHIETAPDGRVGLIKVYEFIPDIILSDVMMPEMDGITMLVKIKSDQRSSHIPIVMLTAKADIESRLDGLERGADAYLAKPFNEEELIIQLKNLIEIRRLLYKRYASMESLPKTDDRAVQIEDTFILKVQKIMEIHLDDETFSIQELCHDTGMSRAQFYRKFKTLTDLTVNEYLRNFRLHKAKCLLETTGLNVSEAGYRTGFKNLSHFSRVFTEKYGMNPSEIHKKNFKGMIQ